MTTGTTNALSSLPVVRIPEMVYTNTGLLSRDGGNLQLVHCGGEFMCTGYKSGACAGHMQQQYIQEYSGNCQCSPLCGNRVVQKGLTKKFEVYFVNVFKGWGIRTVEALRQGSFLFEYAGEVVTNAELFQRGKGATYSLLLDAHWQSKFSKSDEDLLCIDASQCTNLARWMNHRCGDANVVDMPVWIDSTLPTLYHVAYFANVEIVAGEELTWDYGVEFTRSKCEVQPFHYVCGSAFCRMN